MILLKIIWWAFLLLVAFCVLLTIGGFIYCLVRYIITGKSYEDKPPLPPRFANPNDSDNKEYIMGPSPTY